MEDTKLPVTAPDAARPGRPTLRTAALIQRMLGHIRECGLSDTAAALRVGVSASAISRWKRDQPTLIVLFAAAREEFREGKLVLIQSATLRDGRPDWRAAAWILERTFPEDYARHRRPRCAPSADSKEPDGLLSYLQPRTLEEVAADIEAEEISALVEPEPASTDHPAPPEPFAAEPEQKPAAEEHLAPAFHPATAPDEDIPAPPPAPTELAADHSTSVDSALTPEPEHTLADDPVLAALHPATATPPPIAVPASVLADIARLTARRRPSIAVRARLARLRRAYGVPVA